LHENRNDASAVALLAEASSSPYEEIAAGARRALANLEAQPAIDALCGLWAEGRQERLGTILAEQRYVAAAPLKVKALSALKSGRQVVVDRPDMVPLFVSLLDDADEVVRLGADATLRDVPVGPQREALCTEAIREPAGPAAELCLQAGHRPEDPERLCLFLFVTRQLDEYFEEDYAFQNLKLEYERADATIRAHVMDVVRSGDRRCAAFFGTKSRPLSECSESEIKLAVDSWISHEDWPRLFRACLELPLKYSFAAFPAMRGSAWEPESGDEREVYRRILADSDGQITPTTKRPKAESPLFEQLLARGRQSELTTVSESGLLQQLAAAAPPQGVVIVGALAAKSRPGSAAAEAVRQSPHWMVRLAGQIAGLSLELTADTTEDANYWVTELATASGVLELWPGRATPADLDTLANAPAEAFRGKLGAARKVLHTIISHRVTAGIFEEMVVETGEFTAEFVDAEEPQRE